MANEYKTWPILGDFHANIKKELLRRKNQTFGEGNKPRATWVRAVSNAVIPHSITVQETRAGKTGMDLRRDINIMVGGLLRPSGATRGGFEPVYPRVAKGRELLDRPMPGIESISVASKGEFGSLRKITINWTCPSIEDLDILMPYWLSPGISVLVEWGWSNIGQIPIPIDIDDDVQMARLYRFPAEIMEKIVLRGGSNNGAFAGNQDFFIGIITNFAWNMNEDGSFTCTTELTTFGETMLALNLNKDVKTQGVGKKQTKKEKEKEKETLLYGIRKYVELAFNDLNLDAQIKLLDINTEPYLDKRSIIRGIAVEGSTGVSFFSGITAPVITHIPDTKSDIYITWEFIEKKIINDHGCPVIGAEQWFAFEVDSTQTKVSNDKMLYSRNTDVLINNNSNPEMISFSQKPKDYDAKLFGTPEPERDGFLKNVYLRRGFVINTFNNSETLGDAIKIMINKIRAACFDLWDLKIQTNALAENKANIIDQKYVSRTALNEVNNLLDNEPGTNDAIFNFGGYSGQSILRGVSFTSKMINQIALTYFFGKNKSKEQRDDYSKVVYSDDSDVGVNAVYGNTVDRVLRNLKFKTEAELDEDPQNKKDDEEQNVQGKRVYGDEFNDEVKWIEGKRPTKSERFCYRDEHDIALVDQYLRRKKPLDNIQKLIPIYPLELSVTIDGISGILPGNVFTLDNIPKAYKDSGVFQVVEISHEISSDDWVTTLRAFFRPVNRKALFDGDVEKSAEPRAIEREPEDSEIDGDYTTNEPA